MAKITINGISVDPVANHPALAAAHLLSADSSASDYILVQAKQPLVQAQKDELAHLGVTILQYVPEDTYICHYPATDLTPVRALPFVAWANVYMRGFKVHTSLRPGAKGSVSGNLLALMPPDTLSKDSVTVDVVLHEQVSADAVRAKIAAAAGLDPTQLQVGRHKVRLTVPRRRLAALAAVDEVRHIEPYIAPKLANNVARGILRADDAQTGHSLEGEGEIIAVADTGFDKGDTGDVHPAFTGRVLKLYSLGRPNASDPNGHGTHVAGSVLGDGVLADGTLIRGTAPKAQLVLQSLLDSNDSLGGLPADLHDLFTGPYHDDGARVHTNSWGSPAAGDYTSNASEVDDFVWNFRDCVICFAAGNDGADSQRRGVIDNGSVGSPGTAKNCITVGACENMRPDFVDPAHILLYGGGWPGDFPENPIHDDPVASNPNGMVAFSSRGPAVNNRIRPDVVAPGTAILSTRSRVATGDGWGLSPDPLYFYDGGTSMATPLVAGCAAVVRQYLKSQGIARPSAALVKAMLINGATVIPGQYTPPEVGAPPDASQGFGRVDLAATVGPYAAGETVTFKDEIRTLDTGAEAHTTQAVNVNGRTLKVTLVWTDAPGDALQSDLDLIVRTADGQERHGNMAPGSADFDRSNNVEQVVWTGVPSGNVDIVVRAFRVTKPQNYALVVRLT
ncbi:S8 family serine peptidase [Paraburkholderia sediminicola]|uniref:S8 family serine peptidase n=1 Tax=Paraburkholderia sediminicola TaxID=458836 RepID=UPI0038BBE6AE